MLIETGRLIISNFSEQDISREYIEWLNSPVAMKYSNQRFKDHTKESCIFYLKSFENTANSFLKITEVKEEMIGTATIYTNKEHKRADIGLLIGPNYSGMGYGSEAWNAIVQNLRRSQNIQKLTAGTASINIAMRKIIEKSGFFHEATLKGHEIIEEERVDIYYYSQFTEDV